MIIPPYIFAQRPISALVVSFIHLFFLHCYLQFTRQPLRIIRTGSRPSEYKPSLVEKLMLTHRIGALFLSSRQILEQSHCKLPGGPSLRYRRFAFYLHYNSVTHTYFISFSLFTCLWTGTRLLHKPPIAQAGYIHIYITITFLDSTTGLLLFPYAFSWLFLGHSCLDSR